MTRLKVNFHVVLSLRSPAGCVERAVESVSGLEHSCVSQTGGKRSGEVEQGPGECAGTVRAASGGICVPYTLYRPEKWTELEAGEGTQVKDASIQRKRSRQANNMN
jgi:hypothetical protein